MITAALIIIFALCLAFVWVTFRYFKLQPEGAGQHPKAAENSNYNRYYCNLLGTISKAKNSCELKMAQKRVVHFHKQYKDKVNGVSVENDVCMLNRHIGQVRIVLEMHPSTLLN